MPLTDQSSPPTGQEFLFAYLDDTGAQVWLKVDVDWQRLGRLAARALRNKSKRTTTGHGLITVALMTLEERR